MIPKNPFPYIPSIGLLRIAVVMHNITKIEYGFIDFALKIMGANTINYDALNETPILDDSDVLMIEFMDEDILKNLKDWAIEPIVIGRLNNSEYQILKDSDVVSFWDLDIYSLSTALGMIFTLSPKTNSNPFLIWTIKDSFNTKISSLLKFYQIDSMVANSLDFAFYVLGEKKFDILILDWDNCGLEISKLVKEFKKIKLNGIELPLIIGIKDFEKPDLFKDLAGIKDFSKVLFTHKEVWDLLIRSLPFDEKGPIEMLDIELPIIKQKFDTKGQFKIYLDYEKENRLARKENKFSQYELHKMLFRRQFEWIQDI
jgi:hypothetical protein